MSLLPSRPDVSTEAGPRVVGVDSEAADELMSALSSQTAREVLTALHEEPAPPAAVAERVDTTLQNAQYHLENLEEAGAIQVVGTAYSEKGREMDVYAPADEPLVIFAGAEDQAGGLRTALSRLLGGVGALAVGAVAVQEVFGRGIGRLLPSFGAGRPPSAPVDGTPTATATDQAETPTPEPTATGEPGTPTPHHTATETAPPTDTPTVTPTEFPEATDTATRAVVEGGGGLPPGLLFFLGGLIVLIAGIAVTYSRG